MARSSKKSQGSAFGPRKIIQYLIMLLMGGGAGAGGWHFRDSFLGKTVAQIEENHPELAAQVRERVEGVIEERLASKDGVYEVSIEKLAIDKTLVKPSNAESLRLIVSRIGDDGEKQMLWDSKSSGKAAAHVEEDIVTAAWKDSSFQFEWSRGDKVSVEIWEHKGLRSIRLFELTSADNEHAKTKFPLSSGNHSIEPVAKDARIVDPLLNQLTVKSHRVGDLATNAKGATERVAKAKDHGILVK